MKILEKLEEFTDTVSVTNVKWMGRREMFKITNRNHNKKYRIKFCMGKLKPIKKFEFTD